MAKKIAMSWRDPLRRVLKNGHNPPSLKLRRGRLAWLSNKTSIIFIFLITLLPLTTSISIAQSPSPSSVLLIASDKGACATAFTTKEKLIVTNAHVAESLCEFGKCDQVRLFSSQGAGTYANEELKVGSLRIRRILQSLDLAVLEAEQKEKLPEGFSFASSLELKLGQHVQSIGYPGCGTLKEQSGQIKSVNGIHIETSVKGSYGNSGSPVLNDNGQLIGVIIQAEGLKEAFLNVVFNKAFPLRAVRADFLKILISGTEDELLLEEIKALNSFYKESVMPLHGLSRMMQGYQFIAGVQGLRSRMLLENSNPDLSRLLLWFDDYLDALPQIPLPNGSNKELVLKLEKLLVALNLEVNGPNIRLLHPVNLNELNLRLRESGRPTGHIKEISNLVQSALSQGFRGSQINLVVYLCEATLALLLISVLWGASLSIVYFRSNGSLIRRILIMILVGIFLWPLSFVVFFIFRRR